jgi:hypothetical protein
MSSPFSFERVPQPAPRGHAAVYDVDDLVAAEPLQQAGRRRGALA